MHAVLQRAGHNLLVAPGANVAVHNQVAAAAAAAAEVQVGTADWDSEGIDRC